MRDRASYAGGLFSVALAGERHGAGRGGAEALARAQGRGGAGSRRLAGRGGRRRSWRPRSGDGAQRLQDHPRAARHRSTPSREARPDELHRRLRAPQPDQPNRSGIIGRAVDRYEGPLKVSGTAPYAYEVGRPSPPAYGVLVGAEIGCGDVTAVDDAAARAAPGVKLVWHALRSAARPGRDGRQVLCRQPGGGRSGLRRARRPLLRPAGRPRGRRHAGERRTRAAELIEVSYEEDAGGRLRLRARRGRAARERPNSRDRRLRAGLRRGAGPARRDLFHPDPEPLPDGALRHHRLVGGRRGDGPHLGADAASRRSTCWPRRCRSTARNVHLMSRYIGGGFGGKGSTYEDLELAALASRELRPAGEDRADPPADVQRHRPPAGHRAARAAGRDAGRPADRAVR